jgi:hypothetical protein
MSQVARTVVWVSMCDYLYVHGARFLSGECVVEVAIDGVNKRLALVRDGKGRSRLDRWSEAPRKNGVVGEINIRDLRQILGEQGKDTADLWYEDTYMRAVLDRDLSMGREGRDEIDALVKSLGYLDNAGARSIAMSQIRNASYGKESSRETRRRVLVSLEKMSVEDLRSLGVSSSVALSSLEQEDILRSLLAETGLRANPYSSGFPSFSIDIKDGVAAEASDYEKRNFKEVFDKLTGYKVEQKMPSEEIFKEVVRMFKAGEIDAALCSDIGASIKALEAVERVANDEIPSEPSYDGINDVNLKTLLCIDQRLFKASGHMSDDSLVEVLSLISNKDAVCSAWRELYKRGITSDLDYDTLIAVSSTTSTHYSSPIAREIEHALDARETLIAESGHLGYLEVLSKTPSRTTAARLLEDKSDEYLRDAVCKVSPDGAVLGRAAETMAVDIISSRDSGGPYIDSVMDHALKSSDLQLGTYVIKKIDVEGLAELSSDPRPVEEVGVASWCSEGIRELGYRLQREDIEPGEFRSLIEKAVSKACALDLPLTAVAVSRSYSWTRDNTKRELETAWRTIGSFVDSSQSAASVMSAHYKCGDTTLDSSLELKHVTDKWGALVVNECLNAISKKALEREEEVASSGRYVYVADLAYSDESNSFRDVAKTMMSAGSDIGLLQTAIMTQSDAVVEACALTRSNLAFSLTARLSRALTSDSEDSRDAERREHLRQSFVFLNSESLRSKTGSPQVSVVLKAVHQLMGNVDPAGKDTSLLSEYRKELRELRQNLETQGFLADESQASDEIAVHITELTAAYPVETEGTRVVPSVDSSTGNRLLSRVRSGAKKKR